MYHPKLKEINIAKNEGVTYPDYCAALAELTKLKKISVPVESLVGELKDFHSTFKISSILIFCLKFIYSVIFYVGVFFRNQRFQDTLRVS